MSPEKMQLFNMAVAMAKNGEQAAAYEQLKKLYKEYPYEANLLLWLIYTAPSPAESGKYLDKLKKYDPVNPSLPSVEQWLWQKLQLSPIHPKRRIPLAPIIASVVATLSLAIATAGLYFYTSDFKANAVPATAVTVGYERVRETRSTSRRTSTVSYYYNAVVQFRAQDGKDYKLTLGTHSANIPQNGTPYNLLYYRSDPHRIERENFSDEYALIWGLGGGTLIFLLITIGTVVGCLIVGSRREQTLAYQPPAPTIY